MTVPSTAGSVVTVWQHAREWWAAVRKMAALVQRVGSLEAEVAQLKGAVAELKSRARLRPAEPTVDEETGTYMGRVGETRHRFCQVCASKDQWVMVVHEPEETPPWRCPVCRQTYPAGAAGAPVAVGGRRTFGGDE